MATAEISRPYYYSGQFLSAEDFNDEMAYHRDMRRRHNLAHHTYGIVVGLELVTRPRESGSGVDAYVMPGMAIDGYGREILVLRPHQLDPAAFAGLDPTAEVWIRYAEEETARTERGYELCSDDDLFERRRETFRIVPATAATPLSEPDGVVVDGQDVEPADENSEPADVTIPLDKSTPYQELQDDDFWHLRLGTATVDATGEIIAVTNEARSYIGSVSATIHAPDGAIVLKDRALESPLPDRDADGNVVPGVSVTVEGALTVNRDVEAEENLHVGGNAGIGGAPDSAIRLQVTDVSSPSGGSPLGEDIWVRFGDGGDTGRLWLEYGEQGAPLLVLSDRDDPPRLQFQQIGDGDEATPDHSSWIGHGQGGANAIAIMGDGIRLGIGTDDPQATLEVAGTINFSGGEINSTGGDLSLQTAGTTRLTIVGSTGEIGIGTTAPTSALHIRGDDPDLTLDLNSSGPHNLVELRFRMDGALRSNIYWSRLDDRLYLQNQGTNSLVLDGSRVGVGTNAPAEALHVMGHVLMGASGGLYAMGSPQNLHVVVGRVSSGGSVLGGSGFSASRTATGTYRINFNLPTPFVDIPVILATPLDAANNDNVITVNSVSTTTFDVVTTDVDAALAGNLQNTAFSFIALGVRA